MKKLNKIMILLSILMTIMSPCLSMAQQESLKTSTDSFPQTIHYLSTAYLDGIQDMSIQTNADLKRMAQSLSVSIALMCDDNEKTIHQAASQLNHEIKTQLLPEMKKLKNKLGLMTHQVSMHFNPQPRY